MSRQELVTGSPIAVIDADAVSHIGKELGHVREDVRDCTYLAEAQRVLPVKGLSLVSCG